MTQENTPTQSPSDAPAPKRGRRWLKVLLAVVVVVVLLVLLLPTMLLAPLPLVASPPTVVSNPFRSSTPLVPALPSTTGEALSALELPTTSVPFCTATPGLTATSTF